VADNTRGAMRPHAGHAAGWLAVDIGAIAANSPHDRQSYS
jgi:hypothetical protein